MEKRKKPPVEEAFSWSINPGIELFSQSATRQVSWPLPRFTFEFGMESKWDHGARDTRKCVEVLHEGNPQDCIREIESKVIRGQALGLLVRLGFIHC